MSFIYVFSKVHADMLVAEGYKLVKVNEKGSTWAFANHTKMTFAANHQFPYVLSNTMTF